MNTLLVEKITDGVAVEAIDKLEGIHLIVYVLCLGLIGILFYILKTGTKVLKELINELHELGRSQGVISEQLRTLVQVVFQNRFKND